MLYLIVILGGMGILFAKEASIRVWAISFAILAGLLLSYANLHFITKFFLATIFVGLMLASISPLRRRFLSRFLLRAIQSKMPSMSSTEREALEAGTVSFEGEIFSGAPNLGALLQQPKIVLTPEEEAFLNGPVHVLARMLNDWEITHHQTDLPEEAWAYIKEQGFLGLIIPKSYGGLEFSATAQMSILAKLYSCSVSAATTVSVPNSLGPAELLLKYGTDAQKDYYLPRLAKGIDIPCFALTSPNAGSDAASIPDKGIVCYQEVNGQKLLGMRLTWNKRYITLCPVATVIGLAFRLYDPENLLGKGEDIGISCALIPANTPGVIKGRRHFPLNVAFLNGPTQGKDVFVPIDCLIGGPQMAGQGWRMLMECLSAGRAISLPSSASGGTQGAALASGAYARVRKQFNQPIAKFEGIEEPLARIAGHTYIIDAALTMTANAIDRGAKPSVAGAILKYHTTEMARQVAIDGMDIHGGKGICLGPNNYLGRGYQFAPISITVEGANILSRSLIIFGQGAIRCHPYVFQIMESVRTYDLAAFDKALWSHVAFFFANLIKSLVFSLTDGRWIKSPQHTIKRYAQLIVRYSCHLAFLADFSMMVMGGALKRKEKISARLGDILSYLYLTSAVLKRFHTDGALKEDLPIVNWSCQTLLYQCDIAIQGVIHNFPSRWAQIILKLIVQPLGIRRSRPSDTLGKKVSEIITTPGKARDRLTRLVFSEPLPNCPLGRLEAAFHQLCAVEVLEKKVMSAVKGGHIKSLTLLEQIEDARLQKLLTQEEALVLKEAEMARQAVIAVDDFSDAELRREPLITQEKRIGELLPAEVD